jgi:DNA-binding NarL/FixJ family response regulator
MQDSKQVTIIEDTPPELAAYYTESAHSAHNLLQGAVKDAAGDYNILNVNLKAVNQYIKARSSIGELIAQAQAVCDPAESWDPFSNTSQLDSQLSVIQAKAEFTAVTTSESAAVALYQSGLTYREISNHTGMSQKQVKNLVQKQGIRRERKKSVPVIP